jgi:hypothetical protein
MTVASEQWVIVGVISTRMVLIEEKGEVGGCIRISGRLTTASDPRDRGCSGSEMDDIRSGVHYISYATQIMVLLCSQ